MADDPVAEPLEEQEEDEGGPVKSFLEHLEDLRWVLIKSIAAAGMAMLVCLLAGNYAVRILEWPLSRAPMPRPKIPTIGVFLGTNQIGTFSISTNEPLASLVGLENAAAPTNQPIRLRLVPISIGTNQVLGLAPEPDPEGGKPRLPIQIVNLSPAGSFVVATKVAFYGGLVMAAPFILYFVAEFVFPALKMREKKYIYSGLFFAGGLFLIGISFCYFILMPIALAASVQYAEWLGFGAYQWRAEDYIGFVCKFMLGMGVGFELPVVVLTLVKIGVLNYRILAGARRYVIVISFILGAILTTPEVVTQVLMAIPLLLLYEITVWISWYWERQERKKEEASSLG
jgi:sec-independent protein translocase protein TatC